MNTAGGVCLSVLSSLLAVAGALAAVSALALAPLSALAEVAYGADSIPSTGAEGAPSPISSPCSSLVAGVLYGSFSLRELFPSRAPGCSWSLENPDPTKYSLYLRFTRHPVICRTHSPMLLSLDHHLANQSCPLHLQTATARDQEVIDLCGSQSNSDGPYSFLQFDKNFVQLCLTRHPAADEPQVTKELLELRLVEVLLINNENSSQFTCGVLCRWFEECLRTDHNGDQDVSDGDGCGMTQTGCICPNHNIMAPPIPLLPETPHTFSNGSQVPDDCCVTELHSNDAIRVNQKWNTDNTLATEVTVEDQLAQGLKVALDTSFVPNTGKKSGKLKSGYKRDYVNLGCDVDFEGPIIHATAVLGYEGWLAGYQMAFDTAKSKLAQNNFALGYRAGDFQLHTNVNDGTEFGGSIYQKVNDELETAVTLAWTAGSNNTRFGIAAKYKLDKDASLSAKVNNASLIGVGYTQSLRPGVKVTLSALIDGKNFNAGGHKVGMGFELEA